MKLFYVLLLQAVFTAYILLSIAFPLPGLDNPWWLCGAVPLYLWLYLPSEMYLDRLRRCLGPVRWRIRVWLFRTCVVIQRRRKGAHAEQAPLLASVVPILVHSYLAPTECLALWRTSRTLAQAVWRHAPSVRLALHGGILGRASWAWRTTGTMDNRLPTMITSSRPPACIPSSGSTSRQRITSLTLDNMQLSVDRLLALGLPHLRSLTLQDCKLEASDAQGPRPTLALSSLACTNSLSKRHSSCLATALSLCNLSSLQHLTTDNTSVMDGQLHRMLSALQSLRLIRGDVRDCDFELLLAHPTLREVCVRRLGLQKDYTTCACSWQELRVLEHAPAWSLAALPLAGICPAAAGGIQRCVVQQSIGYSGNGRHGNYDKLGTIVRLPALFDATSLVFEPSIVMYLEGLGFTTNSIQVWQRDLGLSLNEPGFQVYVDHPRNDQHPTPVDAAAAPILLQLAARRLVGGTLVISLCDLSHPEAVCWSLSEHLAPTITTVSFQNCQNMPRNPRSLFKHLPHHISRLVVAGSPISPEWVYRRGNITTG